MNVVPSPDVYGRYVTIDETSLFTAGQLKARADRIAAIPGKIADALDRISNADTESEFASAMDEYTRYKGLSR